MSLDLLRQKLPDVEAWVNHTVAAHVAQAHPVATLGFKRLGDYYPPSLLHTTKVVAVSKVPIPPLTQIGLSGFEEFEQLDAAGITYLDTYFVCAKRLRDESLHFHELVHVIQWLHLGSQNFILAYALGIDLAAGIAAIRWNNRPTLYRHDLKSAGRPLTRSLSPVRMLSALSMRSDAKSASHNREAGAQSHMCCKLWLVPKSK